jgi:hypothetical protein
MSYISKLLSAIGFRIAAARRRLPVFSVALLFIAGAAGQVASNPNVLVLPYGPWQLCEGSAGAELLMCSGFTPGNEQFVLMIKATSVQTNKYNFTVLATMKDGTTRVVGGQVTRQDNGASYTVTSLYFGGVPVSFNTTVEETMVTATQTSAGTFQP